MRLPSARSIPTVVMVAVLFAAPIAGVTGVAALQANPTATVDAPDTVEVGNSTNAPLVVENVGSGDDIGAYELSITYNTSAISIDASDSTQFDVETSSEDGELTLVGYTDQSETPGGTLSLASLTITGEAPVDTTSISVDIETLSDTDGNDIPHATRSESLEITSTPDDGDDTDDGDGPSGPSGPGGGGGGQPGAGGGQTGDDSGTTEPVTNITQPAGNQVAVSITNVTANTPVDVSLPDTDVDEASGSSLDGVSVTSRVDTTMNISVERSNDPPANTPAVEESGQGGSFGYFTINADVSDDDIESTTFTFSVSKSKIESADSTPENVVLYRYNEDDQEWRTLETSVAGEEADSYRFSAESPGFSAYSIGYSASQDTTTATTTAQTTEPGTTTTVTETTAEGTTDASPTTEGPGGDDGGELSLYFFVVVAIVALIAAVLYYRRQ